VEVEVREKEEREQKHREQREALALHARRGQFAA
jgi:hypothetical protein